MQVQVAGRKLEVGAALQDRIAAGLEQRVSKYFTRTGEAVVTVSKPGWAFYVDCSIHLPSGVTLQAHGEADDAYAAFEQSLDKIEKRVRRYKNRLKDHHSRAREESAPEFASERVIRAPAAFDDNDEAGEASAASANGADGTLADGEHADGGDAPAIIAEQDTRLRTMTVSMAVMQLELGDAPALLFRNAGNGGLNMVYRRSDGHIGWVDPGERA